MKFAVIVFPGSNCDHDCYSVLKDGLNQETVYVWHKESILPEGVDVVVIPGGFSYGDYLRTGAIARFSPIMQAVIDFANKGGLVFGICNGFQILCEAGLLPGALIRNQSLQFRCENVNIRVETPLTPFTNLCETGQILRIPIAHGEGSYFVDPETLRELKNHRQIVFRYCDDRGRTTPEANPNGSVDHIAGICNKEHNVLGMMPHPERACEALLGSEDGKKLFESIIEHLILSRQKKVA